MRFLRRPAWSRAFLLGMTAPALAVGCGSQSTDPKQIAAATSPSHPLIVQNPSGTPDAFYVPNPIRVRVGQFVTFTNKDTDAHDVTAYSGAFASGAIPAGGTWRWVFSRPGAYKYFCTLHPDMHGEIIVSK